MPRSSGGRSAVRTSRGTPASSASAMAGCRFAAAVPDVHSTAAGRRVACPAPTAKYPAERSSTITLTSIAGCRHRATANGVEREPGERAAWRTPQRASSSTSADASAVLRFVASTPQTLEPMPLQRPIVDLYSQARPRGEMQKTVAQIAFDGGDGAGEQPLGRQSVGQARVARWGEGLHGVGGG